MEYPFIVIALRSIYKWGKPYGIVANALDCDLIVSRFKLQLHYYVHFLINIIGKGTNPPYPSRYG